MKPLLILLFVTLNLVTFSQERYSIVISEIMADPTPAVGLPNNEWIELTNRSEAVIDLEGWRIADASGRSGVMKSFMLQPDSSLIICTGSAVDDLSPFGNTISVSSFPSVSNEGELIYLLSPNEEVIHAVHFSIDWYDNALKKEGGWSLEMIARELPCLGKENWKASVDPRGGTPGQPNSIKAILSDTKSPLLKNVYPLGNNNIILQFDEPLDSSRSILQGDFTINNGITIDSVIILPPLFDQIRLRLSNTLNTATLYTLSVNGVVDCSNNEIVSSSHIIGIPENPLNSELVINEILFDPKPEGQDYVELYNRSQKVFDASQLYIANRNAAGDLNSITKLSEIPRLILPGEYLLLTTETTQLGILYDLQNPDAILQIASLPSFPNDEGTVVLLDAQGIAIDELHYDDNWHFELLANPEGVSLERRDTNAPTQEKQNWSSAASTAGYGTPGYQNSQIIKTENFTGTIEVKPKTFSPDGDGFDDVAKIHFKLPESGYVANVTIYDAAGRIIRSLVKNQSMGQTGYWIWDGLGDRGQRLPIGQYIIFTELFHQQNKKQQFKNVVILARRLK